MAATEPPPAQLAASSPQTASASSALFAAQQIEELFTHFPLMEDAAQGGGDGHRSGLLDSAHLDAKMSGLDHHHGPPRLQVLVEVGHHLLGDPLLELRALGVELEDARKLRQAEDAFAGDVGDVGVAV